MKTILACLAVLATMVLASSAVCAAWTPTTLTTFGSSQTLALTPSYAGSGPFHYEYDLTNPTTGGEPISGFTLTFPTAVPVSSFTNITGPAGWDIVVFPRFNYVDWNQNTGTGLYPGHTMSFSFTSSFEPSSTPVVWAGAFTGMGFSGRTYGPIPEPASVLALVAGLLCFAGLRLRRK